MTTLAKLVVELAANSASFQRDMRSAANVAERNMRRIQDEGRETARGLQKIQQESAMLSQSFRRMGSAIGTLKGIGGGLLAGFGFQQLISDTGRAAIEMERLQRVFTAVTGDAAAGAREFNFVREAANRLGLDLRTTADEYSKVAAAAKGTALEGKGARDIFIGISEASVALGLSAEKTGNALNAIQQSISKGTVSSEELRQQLAEALPSAMRLSADAMGVTVAQLSEMLERGEVLAEDLFPRLARVLHEEYGQAAKDASDDATAGMNRFNNAVNELQAKFGSGFLVEGSSLLEEITGYLRDPAVTSNVEAWGQALGEAIAFVVEHGQTAVKVLAAMGGAVVGLFTAGPIGALIGGGAGLAASFAIPESQSQAIADQRARVAELQAQYDQLQAAAARAGESMGEGMRASWQEARIERAAEMLGEAQSELAKMEGAAKGAGEAVRGIFSNPHAEGGGSIGVAPGAPDPNAALKSALDELAKSLDKAGVASARFADQRKLLGEALAAGEISQERHAELLKLAEEAMGKATRTAGRYGSGIGKAAREAQAFARELERTVESLDPAVRHGNRYADTVATLDKALAKGLINLDKHAMLVGRARDEYEAAVNPLAQYVKDIEQETMLLGLSGREREIQVALLEAEAIARRNGVEFTDELRASVEAAAAAKLDAADAAQELTRSVDPMAQVFEDVASAIHSSWTDLWQGLFDGGISSMKDMGKQLLDMFKSTIARMAALATAKPILVPVITAVGGAFGLGGDQIGGVLGQLGLGGAPAAEGGAPGVGGFGSLFSGLQSNSIGVGLGKLPGIGGLLGQGAGFSNLAFGGAGLLGGLAGKFIGGGTGGSIGGSIGSTLGLAAGGPIGAVLGTIGGSLLGGLFGGKEPSSRLQAGAIDLDDFDVRTSGLTGDKFSQENRDAADALLASVGQFSQLLGAVGGRGAGAIEVAVGDRGGFGLRTEGTGEEFQNFADESEFLTALRDRVAGSFEGLSSDIQLVIDNIDLANLSQAANDLEFAANFRTLFDPQEAVGPFEQAMGALEAQFAEAQKTARRLGLDVDALSESFSRGAGAITQEFNQGIQDAILSIQDPAQAAVVALDREFDALRQEAEAVGGDLVAIEELYGLRRAQLVEGAGQAIEATFADWKSMAEDLAGFSESLLLSDLSPLTGRERLEEAQRQFQDLAAAAAGGDQAAAGQLQGAAKDLLGEARTFFASGPEFERIFDGVRSTLGVLGDRFTGFAETGVPASGDIASQPDTELEMAVQSAVTRFSERTGQAVVPGSAENAVVEALNRLAALEAEAMDEARRESRDAAERDARAQAARDALLSAQRTSVQTGRVA